MNNFSVGDIHEAEAWDLFIQLERDLENMRPNTQITFEELTSDYVTVAQACDIADRVVTTIYTAINNGRIRAHMFHGMYLIEKESLYKYIKLRDKIK